MTLGSEMIICAAVACTLACGQKRDLFGDLAASDAEFAPPYVTGAGQQRRAPDPPNRDLT